eukprot:363550-Alexandrium_andersonii.AAC.1
MSASLVGSEMCIRDRREGAGNCRKRYYPFEPCDSAAALEASETVDAGLGGAGAVAGELAGPLAGTAGELAGPLAGTAGELAGLLDLAGTA